MAVWEVKVVFRYGDRFWSNVWHVDIGTGTDVAPAVIDAFRDFSRNCLFDIYTLERIVRRPVGTSDAFIEIVYGLAGNIALDAAQTLPLWNTIKLLLNSGAGRPGIKFLRGMLADTSLIDDANHINSSVISGVQVAVDDLLNVLSDEAQSLVEGEGDAFVVSASPSNTVQMRQLHRKRRRSV